jgi:ABC-2 type transport system ATP-binding protein
MSSEIAIRVERVSKNFVLPHEKVASVKSAFTGITRKLGGGKTKEIQHALNDISFEIKKGEFFGIVGRNGSGKSTMLKILAGIYQPSNGNIRTIGKLVPFIELGVGFNPELTGRENVYLNGAMLGFSESEIDAMYDDIVSFAELDRFMDQKLKNYSSGMQVRLAFSMATRSEADILLVDEVLAVGDADFQRKCFDYFKKLKREKKTVVFVSHDMDAVREYCDKAIMIEKSKIIATGSADTIATKYTRMFLEEARRDVSDEDKLATRWGTKTMIYEDVSTQVSGDTVIINLVAKANSDAEGPNFGFSVRDAGGQTIMGINTSIKKQRIDRISKGNRVKLKWEFPNIFKDGKYSIELAIQGHNGEIWDWWEDASTLSILKEERTPYITNPAIKLTLEKSK